MIVKTRYLVYGFIFYFRQPPLKQKFYRNMANVMSFFSVGNREDWGYNKMNKPQYISSLITLIFAPFCGVSQVIYFYVNYSELTFDVMGIMFSVFPATILANVRHYTLFYFVLELNINESDWTFHNDEFQL